VTLHEQVRPLETVPTFLTIWKNVYPNFPTRRMVGRDGLLYLKFWAKLTPFEQKRRLSIDICS